MCLAGCYWEENLFTDLVRNCGSGMAVQAVAKMLQNDERSWKRWPVPGVGVGSGVESGADGGNGHEQKQRGLSGKDWWCTLMSHVRTSP
jgi:hypothetical protein